MILLIDNYDSFVFNLARYLERLGQETLVVRNDAIDVAGVQKLRPAAVVLSPGPRRPEQAGCSLEVVRRLHNRMPILGVCLGHQTIAAAFGARVIRAASPMHGRTSQVRHDGQGVFKGLENPLIACRYHSLIVERKSLPGEFIVSAETVEEGIVMAIRHATRPLVGIQFHPESVLTDFGYPLLTNFLEIAGLEIPSLPGHVPSIHDERRSQAKDSPGVPQLPVTF